MSDFLNALLEMGFSRTKAEVALAETGYVGVSEAVQWLVTQQVNEEETFARQAHAGQSNQSDASHSGPPKPCEGKDAGSSGFENVGIEGDGLDPSKRPTVTAMDESGEACASCIGDVGEPLHGIQKSVPAEHENLPDSPKSVEEKKDEPEVTVGGSIEEMSDATISSEGPTGDAAGSLKIQSYVCEDCNCRFHTNDEVKLHASTTGHESFSESAEEIKVLTEEEKKEQLKKAENLIKQRRIEREAQRKREELERERERRRVGQELISARQRMAELEMKRLAEQRRKEKIEAQLAKQRVLEEIERDKAARKGMTPPVRAATASPKIVQQPVKIYDDCRLQIRLTNGMVLTHVFKANEELAAVRLYIQLNRTDGDEPFNLMTAFPRRHFTEEDMSSPLSALGLVPSAVLMVIKKS